MFRTNGKPILLDHLGRPVNHTRDGTARAGGMALPQGWLFIARLMGGDNTLWLDKFDEAIRQSRTDARSMIADSHLMRLKEERIRAVVTLPWELEIPDEKDERQVQIRDALARQIKSIPFLTRILWGLLEALWFGRAAVQVQWGWKKDRGLKYMVPVDQLPISGDSIGHQEDGTPYILVNAAEADKIPNAEIITTMLGLMGLRLTGSWRQRFIFHKHLMEARDPFAFDEVEAIHGVGIRSKIFWSHWLKLEWLSNITDFFSRVGLGINVWKYEQGNAQARTAVETAAKENTDRANIFIPVDPSGGGKGVQGVERIEVPTSGAQFLRELMEYLDRQMETYVVGQEASSKGSSSGLGNEANADFQMDTKKQIALVDAAWLAESLTGSDRNPSLLNQMAWWYCHANRDKLGELDFPISWRFKVGATQSDKQLGAVKTLVELGVPVKADDARMAAGMSKPASGDETIKPPQQGMPGSPGAGQDNPLAGLLGGGGEQGGQPAGGAEQPPEQDGEQEQPLDPASLPDKGPGSFIKMLLESRGGDGASQFVRGDHALHYDWVEAPNSTKDAKGRILWKPTPPDSGPSRRQISKPGTGRGGKKAPDYQPPPDPVQGMVESLKGLDAANITPEQAQQVKDAISKMTVAQMKSLMGALGVKGVSKMRREQLKPHAQEQALQRAGQAPQPAPAPKKPVQPRAASPEAAQARVQADMQALEPHLGQGLNVSQMMKATGLSRQRATVAALELVKAGKADLDDSGRFKRYRAKQEGAPEAAPASQPEATTPAPSSEALAQAPPAEPETPSAPEPAPEAPVEQPQATPTEKPASVTESTSPFGTPETEDEPESSSFAARNDDRFRDDPFAAYRAPKASEKRLAEVGSHQEQLIKQMIADAPRDYSPEAASDRGGEKFHEESKRLGGRVYIPDLRERMQGVPRREFDDALRRLRRTGAIRMVSAGDLSDHTTSQLNNGVPGMNETFLYVEPKNQPEAAAGEQKQPSPPEPPAQPETPTPGAGNLEQRQQQMEALFAGAAINPAITDTAIHAAVDRAGEGLSSRDLASLAQKLGITLKGGLSRQRILDTIRSEIATRKMSFVKYGNQGALTPAQQQAAQRAGEAIKALGIASNPEAEAQSMEQQRQEGLRRLQGAALPAPQTEPQKPATPAAPAPQSAPQTPATQTSLESVLGKEPMTKAELTKRTGMTGDQVFRALQPLERAGLAVSEFKGGSAVYRLTPAGDAVAPLRKLLEQGVTSPGRLEAVLADLRGLDGRGLAAVAKAVGIQPGATAAATLGEIQNKINEKQRQTTQQPFDAAAHVPALKAAVEKHGGPHNLASMVDIRRALPNLTREQQEQVFQEAIDRGILDPSHLEGRHGNSKEAQEAAWQRGDERLGHLSLMNPAPSLRDQYLRLAQRAERHGDPRSAKMYRQYADKEP